MSLEPEHRLRKMTEKGFSFNVEHQLHMLKTCITKWNVSAERLTILLSDSRDDKDIQAERDVLMKLAAELRSSRDRLRDMTLAQEKSSPEIDSAFRVTDTTEAEHHKLIIETSNVLCDLRYEGSTRSRASVSSRNSKSSRHSGRSARSNVGSNKNLSENEGISKIASMKIKLRYLDAESQAKLNYEKIKLQRSLEMAEANLSVSKVEPLTKCFDHIDADILNDVPYISPDVPNDNPSDMPHKIPTDIQNDVTHDGLNYNAVEFVPDRKPVLSQSNVDIPQLHPVSADIPLVKQLFPPTQSIEGELSEVVKTLTQQVMLSRLPPPEPSVFIGDALKYPGWKREFQTLIEHRLVPSSERVHYLRRYLGGPAREAVENFFLLSSDSAYNDALRLLDERFGDPFVVGNAFRDKIENWPRISSRDHVALQKFSDFLRQCSTAMENIQSLRVLDDDRENRKFVAKLPEWLVHKWARIVFQWKNEAGQFPPFKIFSDFVATEAKIANNPVTAIDSSRAKGSRSNDNKSSRTLTTEVKESKPKNSVERTFKCPFCLANHDLDDCLKFLDQSLPERKKFASDKGLCFGCLQTGHFSRKCRRRKVCKECAKLHPTAFHGDVRNSVLQNKFNLASDGKAFDQSQEKKYVPSTSLVSNSGVCDKTSMVVPVYLTHKDNPSQERLVYAMIDTQSDTTFILEQTCQALGLSGPAVQLSLSTMHASDTVVNSKRVHGLSVRGVNCNLNLSLPVTYSIQSIPANKLHIPTPEVAKRWSHLECTSDQLMPLLDCEIGLLIGYNCPRAMMPREVITPDTDGPYAQCTDLGWSIVGIVDPKFNSNQADTFSTLSHRICSHEVTLPDRSKECEDVSFVFQAKTKVFCPADFTRMFALDFSEKGDQVNSSVLVSQDDFSFIKVMEQGIKFEQGHYTMPLPFKGQLPILPNNKQLALNRLNCLKKRLLREATFRQHYENFMNDLLVNGYAEKIPDSELELCNGHEWYIPHHGVYHSKKPDKLRVVFDCSSSFKDHSLNNYLLQGPDLTNSLIGVLCRFRKERVAFTCDIKQMFHQFFVQKEHRDYLRFFWWSDKSYSKVAPYRMCVHLFGATSSPGCANFGMKQIANDNEATFGTDVAEFLRNDFYVDDGLKSLPSVSEAVKMIRSCQDMCKQGGLHLHKFTSNSKEVLAQIPERDRATELSKINIFSDSLPIERTLGVLWNIESDNFEFRITLHDRPLTRRGILSSVSSIYDPLGFIAPVILTGKQILQQMCADNMDWDDPISDELHMKWQHWRNGLFDLESIQVKRCLKPDNFGQVKTVEMHHFSDASTSGYGQCSYLRLIDNDQNVHCSLLMGKSRVTPLKSMTIPRLELTAAVVSVRISCSLQNELHYENATHYFWTDSRVVLGYIANDSKRFQVFVANRVQQIRNITQPDQWHYIDTKGNVADIASRGATPLELNKSDWFNGPKFLWNSDFVPESDINYDLDLSHDPELKRNQCFSSCSTLPEQNTILSNFDYFSDWFCVIRAVAWCLRYKSLLLFRVKEKHMLPSKHTVQTTLTSSLSVEELKRSECEIIRLVQENYFQRELEVLTRHRLDSNKTQPHITRDSRLYKLNPFIDKSGLIRVGGRMRNSSDDFNVNHPIILPRKGHISNLIIRYFHERVQHQGRGITVNELRANGFWILGCSSAVSELLYHCVTCRKLRGKTQIQKMADLPFDRVDPAPPFSYCGVDYFGPFLIKEGRKELKRYGVLFTCFTSRAIHLEIANSLETDSFIQALRRFLSLRGPIRHLRSDRGTNFIGTERELKQELSQMNIDAITNFLKKDGCDYFPFKLNVPSASHMGGVWERQIRTVRNVLTRLLQQQGSQLNDESLRTLFCEASAIVNSRPLSVENINDPLSSAPLTPNHLLTMKSKVLLLPPGKFVPTDLYIRKRWKRVQYLANEFWYRWRKEYLSNLQSRSKWIQSRRNTQEGDIVMIKDDNLPRNQWRIGKVCDATPDDDGLVRKVTVTVMSRSLDSQDKEIRGVIKLERPIHKLVLLKESENEQNC